jgi:hypothetical protein
MASALATLVRSVRPGLLAGAGMLLSFRTDLAPARVCRGRCRPLRCRPLSVIRQNLLPWANSALRQVEFGVPGREGVREFGEFDVEVL